MMLFQEETKPSSPLRRVRDYLSRERYPKKDLLFEIIFFIIPRAALPDLNNLVRIFPW
jgi:hypothetical protein